MKNTKQSNILLSLCVIIFCLFTCAISAKAAEEAEVPRVVFENTRNTEPDLFITKQVVSADERYQAPAGATFSFTLKLGGDLANSVRYYVYNEDGQEVFLYEDGESTENKSNKIPFTTDRSGMFSLKAGQTAKFEYVGTGVHYEVTESEVEGFTQTTPAGGVPAVGSVAAEGTGVTFVNTYVPKVVEAEKAELRIQKSISFPGGYEAPESPDFAFIVKIKGSAYKNEAYQILDTATGNTVGSDTTDDAGRFTLKGGQVAIFADVPADVDYEVVEEEMEGWHAVGKTRLAGAVQAPLTMLSYTNASASFAVSKEMADGSEPEANFSFLLTDEAEQAMADVSYYLYTNGGKRLDDSVYRTDSEGRFTLMAGQTAVFFGLEVGTVFNVLEEVHEDFVQQQPASVNGYQNKTASDAVEVLPFVNKYQSVKLSLNVTKKVSGDVQTDADTVFTFQLKQAEGDRYVPVAGEVYSIEVGGSKSTFKTDAKGNFQVKKNETARFEELTAGNVYQVEELALARGYTIEDAVREGTLEESLFFTFTNQYAVPKTDLYLRKAEKGGSGLAGASFALYEDQELTKKVGDQNYVTDKDGKVTIQGVPDGSYYLVEEKAPKGYELLKKPIKVEIYEKDEKTAIKVDGKEYTTTDESKAIYLTEQPGGNADAHITVYNKNGFALPVTGGSGLTLFVVVVLAVIAGVYFAVYRKTKVNRR